MPSVDDFSGIQSIYQIVKGMIRNIQMAKQNSIRMSFSCILKKCEFILYVKNVIQYFMYDF